MRSRCRPTTICRRLWTTFRRPWRRWATGNRFGFRRHDHHGRIRRCGRQHRQSQLDHPRRFRSNLTGDPGRRITVTTLQEGVPGEMRVNDTTLNDQMFPSIGANETGNYVITWTGLWHERRLPLGVGYLRQTVRSERTLSLWGSDRSSHATQRTDRVWRGNPRVITTDDPANHVVQPSTGYDGVVEISAGGGAGSGTLLLDGGTSYGRPRGVHRIRNHFAARHDFGDSSRSPRATLPSRQASVRAIPITTAIGLTAAGIDLAITLSGSRSGQRTGFGIYRRTTKSARYSIFTVMAIGHRPHRR